MSQPTDDAMANNLIATGGLFAVLMGDDRIQVLSVHLNEMVITLPFMKSAYKVTVEIIEEGDGQGDNAG